jgi:hypothetical protein
MIPIPKTPPEIIELIKGKKKDQVDWNTQYFKSWNNNKYPLIKVNGILIQEHRYMGKLKFHDIPKGMVIHHINGDKKDNREENLQLMNLSEHIKLHRNRNKN